MSRNRQRLRRAIQRRAKRFDESEEHTTLPSKLQNGPTQPTSTPHIMTPQTLRAMQIRHGNRFVNTMVQRQAVATAQDSQRSPAPHLWTYDEFEQQMHQDQNMVTEWWEANVSGYDEQLAAIAQLLSTYHIIAASDQPESQRLKKLMHVAIQIRQKAIAWMSQNGDSFRVDEMTTLISQLNTAIPIIKQNAQPYLGNQYVYGVPSNFTYQELRALDRKIQAMIPTVESEIDKAALQKTLAETRKALGDKVNEIFSSFDNTILSGNFGMPKSTGDRIEFLEYTAVYLGGIDNAINHYRQIRETNVPGTVYLHADAATRLEAVAADLGGQMPASWVALGVRGRYRAHTRTSNGRMAHPLGFAIDYRANDNPMLTGTNFDLANLDARMQSGNADERITMQLGSSSKRRGLISAMGNGTATPEQIAAFEQALASEFDRVTALSDGFGDALGPDAATKLKALHTRLTTNHDNAKANTRAIGKLEAEIQQLQKKQERASEQEKVSLQDKQAELEQLQAEQLTIKQDHYLIWQGIQAIFKPYLDQIAAEQQGLGADVQTAAVARLGEAVAKLGDLESGVKSDLDTIISSDSAGNPEEQMAAFTKFFQNFTTTYATLTADAHTALAAEQRYKSRKRAAMSTFASNITAITGLAQQFETIKSSLSVPDDSEAFELPDGASELMQQTKSALFDWFSAIVKTKQSKEAGKLNTNHRWKRGAQRQWRDLQKLKNALMWNDHFIFVGERNASNPSVVRTMEHGYFNADSEPDDPENFNPNKHGFNLKFLTTMARHGFDLGVAWSSVTDAMHFELVDSVDALPSDRSAVEAELNTVLQDLVNRGVIIETRAKGDEIKDGESSQTIHRRFGSNYKKVAKGRGLTLPSDS